MLKICLEYYLVATWLWRTEERGRVAWTHRKTDWKPPQTVCLILWTRHVAYPFWLVRTVQAELQNPPNKPAPFRLPKNLNLVQLKISIWNDNNVLNQNYSMKTFFLAKISEILPWFFLEVHLHGRYRQTLSKQASVRWIFCLALFKTRLDLKALNFKVWSSRAVDDFGF